MNAKQKIISGDEFYKLFERDASLIAAYHIGFVVVTEANKVEDAVLAGSGTLVSVDDRRGILTADHVVQNLVAKKSPIGLILAKHGKSQVHRVLFTPQADQCVVFSRLPYSVLGPDLAFMSLDEQTIGKLTAQKSFYPLARHRELMINDPPPLEHGAWIISGMANEWTSNAEGHGSFHKLKIFKGMIGEVRLGPAAVREGLDYQNVYVQLAGESGWPQDYEGYSGSGIWQILVKDDGGELQTKSRLLSGVAFYQSDPFEKEGVNVREISCHGRQSIYSSLVDAVRSLSPPPHP